MRGLYRTAFSFMLVLAAAATPAAGDFVRDLTEALSVAVEETGTDDAEPEGEPAADTAPESDPTDAASDEGDTQPADGETSD